MLGSSRRRVLAAWGVLAIVVSLTVATAASPADGDAGSSNGFYSMSVENKPSGNTNQDYSNSWTTIATPKQVAQGAPFHFEVDSDYQAVCSANCYVCPDSGCPPTTSSDYAITGSVNVGLYRVTAGTTARDLIDAIDAGNVPPFFPIGTYDGAHGRVINAVNHVTYLDWKPVSVSDAQSDSYPVGCYLVGPQPGDVNTKIDFIGKGSGTFASLTIGDVQGCEPPPTRIIVEKQTNPDGATIGGQLLKFPFTGDISPDGQPVMLGDGESSSRDLPAGTYLVNESAVDGWEVESIVCDDTNSFGVGSTATFTLAEGETVRCVFTNRKRPGSRLVIIEDVSNDSAETFSFSGAVTGVLGDQQSLSASDLIPGTYVVAQATKLGWRVSVSCDHAFSQSGSTVNATVTAGETTTCVFTNTPTGVLQVTAAFAYVSRFITSGATAAGVDGVAVVGPPELIGSVTAICFRSNWTATMQRRSPSTINMLWNGQVGPFESPEASLLDRTTERVGLLLWLSTEKVRYTTCRPPVRVGTRTVSATIPPWPDSRGLISVVGTGQMLRLSHDVSADVYVNGVLATTVEVPSSTNPPTSRLTGQKTTFITF